MLDLLRNNNTLYEFEKAMFENMLNQMKLSDISNNFISKIYAKAVLRRSGQILDNKHKIYFINNFSIYNYTINDINTNILMLYYIGGNIPLDIYIIDSNYDYNDIKVIKCFCKTTGSEIYISKA